MNKNKITALKEKIGSMSKFQRMALCYGAFFIVSGIAMAKIVAVLCGEFSTASYPRALLLSFTSAPGLLLNAVFAAIVLFILTLVSKRNNDLFGTKTEDERGVAISTEGTYGTSEWMDKEEAKQVYEVCPVEDAGGTILGQFTQDGEEIVALPYKKRANRNLILIGPPGSGKSFGYVRTAIFQSVKREESIVITDPKGEIHNDMRKFLEAHGYVVKMFNLVNLKKSDAWDCVREIYDPRTGDIDEQRVVVFCETIMRNTSAGDDDEFWGSGEKNLFKVAVLYTAFMREQALQRLYERHAKELLGKLPYVEDEDRRRICSLMEDKETEMVDRRRMVAELAKRVLGADDLAEQYICSFEQDAPTCNVSDIYFSLLHKDLNAWENCFKVVPLDHPAASAWAIFKGSGDRVQPGFITGLSQRLQLFQMRDVRRIVCNDDIRLEEIGARKTALFLVISDDNATMQTLSSLMFSFLLKDLKEAYDYVNGEGRIPVNIIADEAANTGVWPQFEKTIAAARSREIGISIILQSLPQLSLLYGKDIAEIIIGCCNTILVLGCNDEYTAKYISNLSGVATIRAKSVKDTRSNALGFRQPIQGYSLSEGDGKRNLLNPDEVRMLKEDEILVYSNGRHMLKAKRFGYIDHPFASDPSFVPTSWSELPDAREKYQLTESLDAFSVGDVQNMSETNREIAYNRQIETRAPEKPDKSKSKSGAYIPAEGKPDAKKEKLQNKFKAGM